MLHYRHWPAAAPVVAALLDGERRPDLLVVVDNHSGDGSAAAIASAFPDVDVVESSRNAGYAGGMNLGMRRVLDDGADAVLLLTHDCVLAPDALDLLEARLAEAPHVGVVGPLTALSSRPDTVFAAGCHLDPASWETSLGAVPAAVGDWAGRPPMPCEWLTGSCLLVRAAAVDDAGLMDERYFLYFEEVDYQLHLRRRGWGIECVPAALAWQEPGFIPLELWVRNRLRFLARHAPARVVAREAGVQARSALRELRRGEFDRLGARARGVSRFLLRRWGPPRPAGRRGVVSRS